MTAQKSYSQAKASLEDTMNATDARPVTALDEPCDEVRRAWAADNLRPLWESAVAHPAVPESGR
jgi:hypothetical protein